MSIQLELTVYGPQLATALMNDDEEFAYALNTMAEDGDPVELGGTVAEYLPDADAAIKFLREFADAIEAAK